MKKKRSRKTCKKGHIFYKSSDCDTCPICEKENKPTTGFLSFFSSPVCNAMLAKGIDTLEKLSNFTEKEILSLHGIGKTSLPIFRTLLADAGLNFKEAKKVISKINEEISTYHALLTVEDKAIAEMLLEEIMQSLPEAENKVWHGHPVWFLDGNPIVGYSKQKAGMRLMFWSGGGFEEPGLSVRGKKFKDASVFYLKTSDIKKRDLKRWLKKSRDIQWDYKNLVKRKGKLERLK